MDILRADDHRRMRWKNGAGETAEIAIFPEGASVENFGWRISMATVARSGPFSLFPGTDRTLAVLEGAMTLAVAGQPDAQLTPASEAVSFPGDVEAGADVTRPVLDLNAMVRRGVFSARLSRLENAAVTAGEGVAFVLMRSPTTLSGVTELRSGDAIRLEPGEAVAFASAPRGAWLIEIGGA